MVTAIIFRKMVKVGVGEDVRGIKYLSSDVHVNYTKHEAYINIDLISVIYMFSS